MGANWNLRELKLIMRSSEGGWSKIYKTRVQSECLNEWVKEWVWMNEGNVFPQFWYLLKGEEGFLPAA